MIIKTSIPGLADSLVISLESKINVLNKEIVDLNNHINVLNTEHQEQIDTINSVHALEVENLNNNIEDLNTIITEKNSEINELKSNGLNWVDLGYKAAPSYIRDNVNYSANLTDDQIYNSSFENLNLVYLPNLDYSKFTSTINVPKTVEFADVIDLRNIQKVYYANSLFYKCDKLKQVNTIYVDGVECGSLFYTCSSLESVNVIGKPYRLANYMFEGCTKLTELPNQLDLSDVTTVERIFSNCALSGNVKVSYNLDRCTDIMSVFSSCDEVEEFDLSDLYIPEATDATDFFYGCNKLRAISFPKQSKLYTLKSLFSSCTSLETVDVSQIPITPDIEQQINCQSMFKYSGITDINLIPWKNRKVQASEMFSDCKELVKAQFGLAKLTAYDYLFYNCPKLEAIYGLDLINGNGICNAMFMGTGTSNIRDIDIRGIGCIDSSNSSYNNFRIYYSQDLGVNNDQYPDAYTNLINSLVYFSFDRIEAGYKNPYYIYLHANTKALLEQDPNTIAQITAKGFTIA